MNATCSSNVSVPVQREPDKQWEHYALWANVRATLSALPAHFHSDTFIEGVSALDVFALNSALAATIENQVVETLNRVRSAWDPQDRYATCSFVRQPQSFPDVILKDLAHPESAPILGIELKGWYLLAKEAEPSMRFTQTKAACSPADMIMVVPWTLNSVISGRPVIFSPYVAGAQYAAEYRNYYWQCLRGQKSDNSIVIPENARPYPKKNEPTTDKPVSDNGGNFGRIARSGMMNDYLERMRIQPVCGIASRHWLEFFKLFHQDATENEIQEGLAKLRVRVNAEDSAAHRKAILGIIAAIENLLDCQIEP